MERRFILVCVLILCVSSVQVLGEYHQEGKHHDLKEKVTHLHFYLHDILSGDNPSAVLVAQSNRTSKDSKSATPFGSVYAIDDPLTEGPEPTSKVIGNAQGTYVSTGRDKLSLVMSVDFGFMIGKFNGSSISVLSRNPVTEGHRELAVVGGRGKFRLARGFAKLRTHYLNVTNGDAIIEYKVTVYHY
ncbi:Plant disease resistance response protein [Macleaya cordata]|uniref:Dirigent protein n=1 Tax=Macleaya cordata TaxID=56857 RepID=A0A200Q791_MACCD|nr:Plant disease resistance response protein [Macleaya cordata]